MATKDKLPSFEDIWGAPHTTPLPMRAGEITGIAASRGTGKSTVRAKAAKKPKGKGKRK